MNKILIWSTAIGGLLACVILAPLARKREKENKEYDAKMKAELQEMFKDEFPICAFEFEKFTL